MYIGCTCPEPDVIPEFDAGFGWACSYPDPIVIPEFVTGFG
jgi:hypothetical protein